MGNTLDQSVTCVKGIGPQKQALFADLGIATVRELLNHFPRDYEDRSRVNGISSLTDGMACSFRGRIVGRVTKRRTANGLTLTSAVVTDGTGAATLVWFNQDYIKNALFPGADYLFFGKAVRGNKGLEIRNPIFEKDSGSESVKMLRIVPVYPAVAGLTQNAIRAAIFEALRMAAGGFEEFLPEDLLRDHHLMEIDPAYRNVHFPESPEDFHAARRRFVFQELFLLQTALLAMKNSCKCGKKGAVFGGHEQEMSRFLAGLPYELTGAQIRAIEEISIDFAGGSVMNRLVQGDVGSGKTVVAAAAILKAALSGYQSALMAPTEILARQHFATLQTLLGGLKIALLVGGSGMDPAERKTTLEGLKDGSVDLVIGTHALIQSGVGFKKLGFVITDEQHRFGVRQRAALAAKGSDPHIMVMSATPIPRTLALILFGDLDITVIDELPPGRKPVETYAVNEVMRTRINDFIRGKVGENRQVYIVCPLIESSDENDSRAAIDTAAEAVKEFAGLNVGLMHGKMKAAEKEKVMSEFADGRVDILVSTTVIEVGVDVPNATVMVVENADRFGLAQLHQLRGRVGRGRDQSYCILFNDSTSEYSKQRMKTMRETHDGFVISEKDLEIRGPGDFFGVMQHGLPELKISNLYSDIDILKEAQKTAISLVEKDPALETDAGRLVRANMPKLDRLQL